MMKVSSATRAFSAGAIAALLVGCGGSQSTIVPPPTRPNAAQLPDGRGGGPTSHCIVVANAGPSAGGAILFFARSANGNAHPVGKIEGPLTQINYPTAIAMDSA